MTGMANKKSPLDMLMERHGFTLEEHNYRLARYRKGDITVDVLHADHSWRVTGKDRMAVGHSGSGHDSLHAHLAAIV